MHRTIHNDHIQGCGKRSWAERCMQTQGRAGVGGDVACGLRIACEGHVKHDGGVWTG